MISVYLSLGSVITFTKITTVMIKDLNKLCTLTKKVSFNVLNGWSVMFDPSTRLDVNKIQFTCRTQSLCRIDEKLLASIMLIALAGIN